MRMTVLQPNTAAHAKATHPTQLSILVYFKALSRELNIGKIKILSVYLKEGVMFPSYLYFRRRKFSNFILNYYLPEHYSETLFLPNINKVTVPFF